MRGARVAGGLGVLLAFGFFVSLTAVRCTYSPDFPSGELQCSTVHSCPEGYFCDGPSNACWKNGTTPSGAAGTGGTAGGAAGMGGGTAGSGGMSGAGGHAGAGGAGGAAGMGGAGGAKGSTCAGTCSITINGTLVNSNAPVAPPPPGNKFVGHWVFQTGSTETVSCSDGSSKTNDLTSDYVDVAILSDVLTASYFCDWNLVVGAAGNQTVIKPGQTCSRNVTDPKTGVTHFTWHGTTFQIKSDDSQHGSLSAMIAVDYIDDPLKTGCSP